MRVLCPICHFGKTSLDGLEAHLSSQHLDYLQYKCMECKTRRHSREQMIEHCWVVHNVGEGEIISIVTDEMKDAKLQKLLQQAVNSICDQSLSPLTTLTVASAPAPAAVSTSAHSKSLKRNALFADPLTSSVVPTSQIKTKTSDNTALNASVAHHSPSRIARSRNVGPIRIFDNTPAKSSPAQKTKCKLCGDDVISTTFSMRLHTHKHLFNNQNLAFFLCSFPGCGFKHYAKNIVSSHTSQSHSQSQGRFPVKTNPSRELIARAEALLEQCFGEKQPRTGNDADELNKKCVRLSAPSRVRSVSKHILTPFKWRNIPNNQPDYSNVLTADHPSMSLITIKPEEDEENRSEGRVKEEAGTEENYY